MIVEQIFLLLNPSPHILLIIKFNIGQQNTNVPRFAPKNQVTLI